MIFNSLEFILFFILVLLVFYALPFSKGKSFLVLSSFFFYMWWNPWFMLLMGFSILFNFFIGLKLQNEEAERGKTILIFGIVVNLLYLGFFKYYNFLVSTAGTIFHFPFEHFVLEIVLPVGISFFTFESISYITDVYWKKLEAKSKLSDYALFISFFPHLIAGPIIRPRDFFPQLDTAKKWDVVQFEEGFFLFIIGLIKKIVFADQFAIVSDHYFGSFAQNVPHGAAQAWGAMVCYSMQIFFDFSGYTDMARGSAKMLGFEFPVNFARPYLAVNIQDFWRRWHISLSTWLRDYIYIPLGGGRVSEWKVHRNLMITMFWGGLWHGASWNFAIWGVYHGVLLSFHRLISRKGSSESDRPSNWIIQSFKMLATFFLVLIGWVPFRSPSWEVTWKVYREMFFSWENPGRFLDSGLGLALIASTFLALAEEKNQVLSKIHRISVKQKVALGVLVLFILEIFSMTDAHIPFIYFQF